MKKEFKGNANKSGIYQIRNLVNDKIYIGSTKSFKVRAKQHEIRLGKGKHHNKHLLASWKKHGTDNFLFEILETVKGTTKERRRREQHYINQHLDKWDMCYNLSRYVIQARRPWSRTPEISRRKMSKSAKNRWKDKKYKEYFGQMMKEKWRNPKYRTKLIEAHLGQVAWNKGKKLTETHKVNLKKSLTGRHISDQHRKNIGLASARRKHTEKSKQKIREAKLGKQHSKEIKNKISKNRTGKGCKTYYLIDPNGNKIIVTNMVKFCAQNDFLYKSIGSMLCGKTKSYKGYKLVYENKTNSIVEIE